MEKAVIYARYSSDKQTEQSIEGQLRVCHEYAERMGIAVIGEYIDRALTGKSDDRPQFQRMITDAKSEEFKFVIVYKLDRFSRNRYDSAHYKHILKQYGVKVLSATEQISDSPESIMTEAILEGIAEYYSSELAQKVRRGMKESALKANSTGGFIPLGYKIENKKLVIDEATAEIPRIVFEMYAQGKGAKKIADTLNSKGYRTQTGKPFTMTNFRYMLRNKKYIGIYSYNDEIEIEGGCPALIDVETFDRVQKVLEKTKKAPAAAKAKVNYLLTTKLFCGYCGTSMVGESGKSRNGNTYNYYACRKKKKERSCHKLNERKDYIEWYICEQVIEFINLVEHQDQLAAKIVEAYKKAFDTSGIPEIEKRLERVKKDIDNIVNLMAKTGAESLIPKLEALEFQKEEIEVDLSQAKIAARHIPTEQSIKEWLAKFKKLDIMVESHREKIIDTFVNSVYLYDDKMTIFFNMKNCQETITFEQIRDHEIAAEDCSDLTLLGEP